MRGRRMVSNGISTGDWLLSVTLALKNAGGTARLQQIYRWIEMNRRPLPEHWEETVRATIYYHSSDSGTVKKRSPAVFVNKGPGRWALRNPSERVSGKAYERLRIQVFLSMTNHELESLSGKSLGEIHAYIDQQIEKKTRKAKIE
jgi:hypothetical protein